MLFDYVIVVLVWLTPCYKHHHLFFLYSISCCFFLAILARWWKCVWECVWAAGWVCSCHKPLQWVIVPIPRPCRFTFKNEIPIYVCRFLIRYVNKIECENFPLGQSDIIKMLIYSACSNFQLPNVQNPLKLHPFHSRRLFEGIVLHPGVRVKGLWSRVRSDSWGHSVPAGHSSLSPSHHDGLVLDGHGVPDFPLDDVVEVGFLQDLCFDFFP